MLIFLLADEWMTNILSISFALDSVIRTQESLNQVSESDTSSKSGSAELSPASFPGKEKV